ncbi:MAG: hypothetical protein J6V68_02795 [Clostridia bacterium]|nr:hypothetical protein [Clostridia bacterium]
MNEFFEEVVPLVNNKKALKKRAIYKYISIIGIVFAIIGLFIAPVIPTKNGIFDCSNPINLLNYLFLFLYFGTFIFIAVFFGKKSNKTICEYDYIISGDNVAFTAVYNGSSRKVLNRVSLKSIYKLGKIDSDSYKKIVANPMVKTYDFTVNETPCESKKFFYLAYKNSLEHAVLHVECDEKFIIAIIKSNGKDVVEEGYGK